MSRYLFDKYEREMIYGQDMIRRSEVQILFRLHCLLGHFEIKIIGTEITE